MPPLCEQRAVRKLLGCQAGALLHVRRHCREAHVRPPPATAPSQTAYIRVYTLVYRQCRGQGEPGEGGSPRARAALAGGIACCGRSRGRDRGRWAEEQRGRGGSRSLAPHRMQA